MTLAHIVKNAGLDGVVCSTKEAPRIKQKLGEEFLTVTPGIRFDQLSPHDQKRTGTLQEAVKVSDFIIMVGLNRSPNPQEAIRTLQERWNNSHDSLGNS